ncbi:hypothetical protein D6779_02510 [Candidatus Parcubacteria bacterium]|nr:MAG: hypothetical protein D6779_02510 [Candidatus Parcubacteria bacterium]
MRQYSLSFLIILAVVSGCASQPSPEEIEKMRQAQIEAAKKYQAELQRAQQKAAASTSNDTSVQNSSNLSVPTEKDISARISKVRAASDKHVKFKSLADGFEINGVRFVDPEGGIKFYRYNPSNGDLTYIAKIDDSHYVGKYINVSMPSDKIKIADITYQNKVWKVTTVTGKTMNGSDIFVASKGLLATRGSAGFWYEPGTGIHSIGAPEGYHIAGYQRGDVSTTHCILLEQNKPEQGSLSDLWSATKQVGAIFGGEGDANYALFNINNGKLYKLPVGWPPENPYPYDYHGQGVKTKNSSHYYWRIVWFPGKAGVFAAYTKNGLRKTMLWHLDSGLKKMAFERGLGIVSIDYFVTDSGTSALQGDLGFETKVISDVDKFMAETTQQ